MNKSLVILLVSWYLFNQDLLYCQTIKTIIVDFIRKVKENKSEEIVKGCIYYQAPAKIVVEVYEPVNQWMFFEGNILFIYYPKEQKAFRIRSKNPFVLSFFQSFIGVVKNDLGFYEIGFSLVKREIRNDTLITYWKPSKKIKKILGNAVVGAVKDKLIFVEMQDAKGKKFVKTTYNNYFQYNKTFFPLEISSVMYEKKDSIFEKVIYSNPKLNVPLPQKVVDFKIPTNIEIKKIEW